MRLAALLLVFCTAAYAQYPDKPLRLDLPAHHVADRAREHRLVHRLPGREMLAHRLEDLRRPRQATGMRGTDLFHRLIVDRPCASPPCSSFSALPLTRNIRTSLCASSCRRTTSPTVRASIASSIAFPVVKCSRTASRICGGRGRLPVCVVRIFSIAL